VSSIITIVLVVFAAAAGIAGGMSAKQFAASGKVALALGLIPMAGFGLGEAIC